MQCSLRSVWLRLFGVIKILVWGVSAIIIITAVRVVGDNAIQDGWKGKMTVG